MLSSLALARSAWCHQVVPGTKATFEGLDFCPESCVVTDTASSEKGIRVGT